MSFIVIGKNGNCDITHLSFYAISRTLVENKIVSCFRPGESITRITISERTGMPFSRLRNHLDRMVREGKLKRIKKRVVADNNCKTSYYEVVE